MLKHMKVALIVSRVDPAGINIKEQLLRTKEWKHIGIFQGNHYYEYSDTKNKIWLFTSEKDSVYCENIDIEIMNTVDKDIDLVMFATQHKSKSKIPSLSIHTQGNWAKAEYGGKERTLCTAPANILKTAFIKLQHNSTRLEGFDIIQECTHHGPFVSKPSMFIEIGSSLPQWQDKEAGKVIAETIFDLLEGKMLQDRVAFGIGGLHHTPIFGKVMERKDIAFGHVCPKYMLEELDKEMIKQALDKTMEKVDLIALDWKGLGKEKERIILMLEDMKLKWEKFKY